MLLKDKVAVITGSAKGIGKSIAEEMANEGAKVVIADILESGIKTAEEIKKNNHDALYVNADVCSFESLNKCKEIILEKYGHIDILVVNAGISFTRKIHELTIEEWEKVININLTGSFLTIKAFLDDILSVDKGKIVFITSGSAFTGSGGGAHYASSKSGQHGLVRSLARELGPKGINVNAIAPRVIETDILNKLYPTIDDREKLIAKIPIGRIGQPKDIANLACFLASEKSSYINGQIILLDGGRTFS